jgi:mono/diheme cytochrome c family protein
VRPRPQDFLGSLSCSSASCHGGAEIWGPTGLIGHHEYVRWIGTEAKYAKGRQGYDPHARLESSNADPHSLAAWRMTQPRFRDVLRKASLRSDGSTDEHMSQRCAACHDPLGLATGGYSPRNEADRKLVSLQPHHQKPHAPAHPKEENELLQGVAVMRGISCESCHGGAARWISNHFRRDVSREWLEEHGMIDTKNVFLRARQCAACHVGSAEQDMNHDMIAAGHPPLRFEQASYEALLAGKHWNDRPLRDANPNYEIQLWAAGRIAAAEAALALLESRATEAAKQAPWPEFAESNCFSCHQPLRPNSEKLPLAGLLEKRATIPAWQKWNAALVGVAADPLLANLGALPPPQISLHETMQELRKTMEESQAADASMVAKLAGDSKCALHAQVRQLLERQNATNQNGGLTIQGMLAGLGPMTKVASWDEACQNLAALVAAERALRDHGVTAAADCRRRLKVIAQELRFGQGGTDWPVVFTGARSMSSDTLLSELEMARQELQATAQMIPSGR